jgi:carbohydrate kinase (thermoresistant glucokinase family)
VLGLGAAERTMTDQHQHRHRYLPNVIVLMGVSGTGKTTVGRALAQRLGFEYVEGDDHHPRVNVEKMRQGIPLDDHDRAPWLSALASAIDQWIRRGSKRRLVVLGPQA